ncbi:MAG TPA: CYTH and CHAD domain-containing protein [Actinomycetota bacterium]|nr:CYTH and CHAD domain-containing protein [Actinomycetota bacterium]
MQEREAKLAAPPGFDLPDLAGPDDGVQAEPQPERRLTTTYYDTPDLRLARWGASLRYRPGEGWTVKLPEGRTGVLLVRAEHVFSGDGRKPPPEALALVRPFVRTSRVAPSARMRTVRRPVELRDPAGSRLAEVVDDDVQLLEGRRVAGRFRELEVELDEDADAGLLDQVVDRLLEAGAQAAEPTPKYLRALGGRDRTLGPEVVEPEVDSGSSVETLLRHDLASGTLRLFRHEAGVRIGEDPEAVHQARVASRRIRSTLRTFSSLLDEEWTDRLRDDLKWVANLLGEVRDTDVLLERFSEHLAALPATDAKPGRRLLERLATQRDQARRSLLGAMASDKYARLLDDLVAAAAAPALLPGGDRPAAEVMPPLVVKPWKKLRKAVREAGDDPPDDELHQIRIRAKRARYAAEAVEPVIGKPAEDFADAIADLQGVLGDHQDAVVGEAWLREAAAASRRDVALVAGLLIAAERASADDTRAGWRKVWKAANRSSLRAWLP